MYENLLIKPDATIKQAILKLNENAKQILFVVDQDNKLIGTLTDGDIRRGLIKDIQLTENVEKIMYKDFLYLGNNEREKAKELLEKKFMAAIPILDDSGKIVDIELRIKKNKSYSEKSNIVFILAGGKGTRLSPVTNILPKPLIPIGETPIVEMVMNQWKGFGFHNFVLSVNYKAEMIKAYFTDLYADYNLSFVQEKQYLGTGGSISLVKNKVTETILVANCDVLLDFDMDEFFQFHRLSGDDITVVGVVRQVKIPYGVMEMENGKLLGMKEKPEYEFIVNAGIYALEPQTIKDVREDEYLDMPTLIENIRKNGGKVGVFPVSSELIDVGHWEEYEKAVRKFGISK